MTLSLRPPPLQVPTELRKDSVVAAFLVALINTVYQIWTAVYNMQVQGKVSTTNATPTQIFAVDIPLSSVVMMVAKVAAHRTGGSSGTLDDSGFYHLVGAYKNSAGVLSAVGTAHLIHGGDQAGWTLSFTTVGTSAIVQVTGATNNNVTWQGSVSTFTAGA